MKDIKRYLELLDKSVFDSASHLYETSVQLAENDGNWNANLHHRLLDGTQQVADDMKHIMTVLKDLAALIESLKNPE